MTIPPITGSTTTTPTPTAADTNQLNQDTFLKLLVAQMKYQDPLAPTDSTQFLTQTAQFTTVSTLQQIEKDQQAMQHTNELLAASGMVGRGGASSRRGSPDERPPPLPCRSAGTSRRTRRSART